MTDGAIREEVYGDRVVYVDCGVNTTVPAGADFIMCYSVAEGLCIILLPDLKSYHLFHFSH